MPKTICNILIELGVIVLIIFPPILFGAILHIHFIQLLVWGLGLVWIVKVWLKKSVTYISSPYDLPIVLLLLWSIVNLITSTYAHRTEQALYLITCYALLYFLIIQHLRTVRRLVGLAFIIILIGSGESVFGIIQYLRGATTILGHPTPNIGTLNATYFSHNHFAGFLILVIPIAFGLLAGSSNWEKKGFLFLLVGLMGTALVLSLSRGGLLSFIIAIIGFFVCLASKHAQYTGTWKQYLIIVLLIVLCITAVVAWIGISPIAHRSLVDTFLPNKDTFGEEIRFTLWRNALPLIQEFPVFGSGLGTFEYVFQRYRPHSLPQKQQAFYAHNDYLELTIEMGLPALVLVLWGMFRFYRYGLQIFFRHSNPVLTSLLLGGLTSCTAIFVHSIFDFNLQIPANALLFVAILALTTSAAHLILQRQGAFREKERRLKSLGSAIIYDHPKAYHWKTSWKLIIVPLCILVILGISFRQQIALRYYSQGNSNRAVGQFFLAIPAYQTAIKIDPWNAEFHEALAQLYHQIGKATPHSEKWYQLAVETFQQAIRLHPYQSAFYYQLGQVFDLLDQETEAIQAFQTAVKYNPRLAFYSENLGHYLLYLQQTDAALNAYSQALSLDFSRMSAILPTCQKYHVPYETFQPIIPEDPILRQQFAEWLAQHDMWQLAKVEYRKAIELSGQEEDFYVAMQGACRQRQDYDCLREGWRELAQHQPENPAMFLNIAESFAQQQQWDDALREYETLFERFPDNPEIYQRLGQLYQQQGRWDDAIRHYQQLIDQIPEHIPLYHALAGIYRQRNQWQEAINIYRAALASGLTQPEIPAELGALYEEIGDTQQAIAYYEQAVQSGETRFNVFQKIEQLYQQTNRPQQQILWDMYVMANVQKPEALFPLAQHYQARGEWLNAVKLTKEVIANAPTKAEYRVFLADLYTQQNMTFEAIEQWEKLVTLNTGNIEYHLRLAALYEQIEEWSKAKTQYRQVLRIAPGHEQAQQKLAALGG